MPSAAATTTGSEASGNVQCTCAVPPMPAASKMKRHSAPTESRPSSPPPPPLPPRLLASPTHPSRPPHDDESDATSLTSRTSGGSDGGGGDKKVKAAQSFEALYNNEKLSDFLLDVNQGMYVFHSHKMIVGLKSERLAALITTTTTTTTTATTSASSSLSSGGSVSTSNTSSSLSTSVHNYIPSSNTTTFTAGQSHSDKGKLSPQLDSPGSGNVKPTLYLQETPECGAVFGRFLYFIYSGAVWLHRDYVLPLHTLSVKYGVAALAAHCENYITQLLHKCLQALHTASNTASASHGVSTQTSGTSGTSNSDGTPSCPKPSTQPALGTLLAVTAVCDVYESSWDMFSDGTRRDAFAVLTRRFAELCHVDRWAGCSWTTVRDLLRSDACACDENVMLVAATDWMKRTRLQDKARIQELLSSIRYPRLPRRVLYHLHTTASFRNFPPVQALIEAAIRYHCFRDVPEARDEFTGRQYKTRGGARPASRHTVCGGEHASCCRGQGQGCDTDTVTSCDGGDMSGSNTSSSGGNTTNMSNCNSNSNYNINPHDIAQPNEWGCYGDPLEVSQTSGSAVERCNMGDNNSNMEHTQRHQHRAATQVSPDLVAQPRSPINNNNNNNSSSSNNSSNTNGQRGNKNHHHHRRGHHQHHNNHHGCRSQQTARNNRHQNQQQQQQQQQQHHQHQYHHQQQQHHNHPVNQEYLHHHQQQQQYHQQQQQQQQHQPDHPPQCRGCHEVRARHQGSPVATVQPRVHTPPPATRDSPRQAVIHTNNMMTSSGHGELVRHVDAMNSTSDLCVQPPPFTRV